MHEILTNWGIFAYISIFILILVVAYILFMFYVLFCDIKRSNTQYRIKILDDGLEIYSNQKGKISFYEYDEIASIRVLNTHPISYTALILKNKQIIPLYATVSFPFIKQFQEKNITIPIECEEGAEWRIANMGITPIIVEEEEIDLKIKNSMEFK